MVGTSGGSDDPASQCITSAEDGLAELDRALSALLSEYNEHEMAFAGRCGWCASVAKAALNGISGRGIPAHTTDQAHTCVLCGPRHLLAPANFKAEFESTLESAFQADHQLRAAENQQIDGIVQEVHAILDNTDGTNSAYGTTRGQIIQAEYI